MSLTFPEPMSYSLTVTESGGLTLGLTGPAGPAGPTGATGGVTSVAGRTGSITLVSADITNASTGANGTADNGKLVKFNNLGGLAASGDGITINGDTASIYTDGYNATIHTSGQDGHIFTSGTSATVYTLGDGAPIYTAGNSSTISTAGEVAHIFTTGVNAYIQSRSTFNLFNGANTTTLSHAPTANRAIAFADASGTLPTVPPYASLALANAAALGAGTFFWDTTLKKLRVTTA